MPRDQAGPSHRSDEPAPRPVDRVRWGMVVHGGAGTMRRDRMTPDLDRGFRRGLDDGLVAGHAVLAAGGTALDAVEAAVVMLENDPLFNAGRGAVFAHDGTHSLDASVMDGTCGAAGAVAGVPGVKNPVRLARAVMEHSPHVLLMGRGALELAELKGLELAPPRYFETAERRRQYERALAGLEIADDQGTPKDRFREGEADGPGYGTVGAVALDRNGGLAAATSTGGMTNKRWGRVGDSPIIGAGTFADRQCAVGGTGWGEYFLRTVTAFDVVARMRYGGVDLATAAHQVVMVDLQGLAPSTGGVIGIDARGHMVWTHNTPGMYRGRVDQDGVRHVAIYREEG